jgi:hypothetical protein
MIRQQDRALDSISGTLTTLAQQAGLIGQEVGEHNECVSTYLVTLGTRGFGRTAALVLTAEFTRLLNDFEAQVDRTEGKLAAATRRMNFFLQKAEGENLSL